MCKKSDFTSDWMTFSFALITKTSTVFDCITNEYPANGATISHYIQIRMVGQLPREQALKFAWVVDV